jgi:hypothetical protein
MEAKIEAKPSSKAQHEKFIQRLRNHYKIPDASHTFLKDTAKVIPYVETLSESINTRKTYFTHITSVLRDLKSPEMEKALADYRAKMTTYKEKYEAHAKTQTSTDAEKAKWNSWTDILKVRESLAKKATDWKTFQKYLIICLYTFIEPQRIDYTPMKFVSALPKVKEGDRNYNVCLMTASSAKFIFNEYKSDRTYGTRQIDVPSDLFTVLQDWRKYNKSEWLLVMSDKETPLPESALGTKIADIFEAETGKRSGVNTLRHAFISHQRKCEMSLTEKEKMSLNMGHSASTNERYRRIDL